MPWTSDEQIENNDEELEHEEDEIYDKSLR